MAIPAFLEAINLADIIGEIVATEWSAAGEALTVARAPTAVEAAQGTIGVAGLVGFEPAAKAVVGKMAKRKAPPSIEPPTKKIKPTNQANFNHTIQQNINHTVGNLEEDDMNAIGENMHMRVEDRLSGGLSTDKFVSQSNSSVTTHRSINSGSHGMNPNTVDEVPVMPAGRVSKSHPEYFTVDLPFYTNFEMQLNSGETLEEQYIRLDSPYDPIVDGDFSESRQPLGRDTWAGIYDFYRVLEADVTMKFTYTHGSFGDNQPTAPHNWDGKNPIHAMIGYHVTDDASDKATNPIAFVEMKHSKASYIHPHQVHVETIAPGVTTINSAIRQINCFGGTGVMQFHYQPEHWDYHVTNLGLQERWTPKDSVPDFTHLLGIVVGYANNNAALKTNEVIHIHVDLYVKYKTQWREVNSTKKRTIDS